MSRRIVCGRREYFDIRIFDQLTAGIVGDAQSGRPVFFCKSQSVYHQFCLSGKGNADGQIAFPQLTGRYKSLCCVGVGGGIKPQPLKFGEGEVAYDPGIADPEKNNAFRLGYG